MPNTTLVWMDDTTEDGDRNNRAVLRQVDGMIDAGEREELLQSLSGWSATETMSCLLSLRTHRAQKMFRWLPDQLSLKVLVELDDDLHAVLFSDASVEKFRKLVAQMSADEAVDTLLELPEDLVEQVIGPREDAGVIRAVLNAREDSVATVMRLGALSVPRDWTIAQLTDDLRARTNEIEKIDMMFVVDAQNHPVGYLRFREVLLARPETSITSLVHEDVVVVSADTDREEVLQMAEARSLHAIGVVDAQGRLVGGVAPTELGEIRRDEAEEDLLKLGGVSPESTQFDGPLEILKRRLPWLIVGLCGASAAAVVVVAYEEALAQAAILASFIPVVMAMAGNAGIQASTVSVQTITSGVNWRGDFGARILRELMGATLNGLFIGSAAAALVMFASLFVAIADPGWLALTSVMALTLVTMLAGTVGAVIPFALKALKLDPAVATGIFITTTNDVFGVLIFFMVASGLYL